jgi:tripartite-type tricarboxylate transporter receptor subunit TctC
MRAGLLVALALPATALATSAPAGAQDYPTRPITLIVPFVAGGGVDVMGRIIAQKLAASFGQQVVIENRPGAGGVIGTRAVARAPPDGYTLGMMITGASLPPNTGYDVARDFAPIGLISSTPIVVMTHEAMPAQSLGDVIALARKEPGRISAGTPPPPTVNYFAAELFKAIAADITIVSYRGTAPLTNDLLGGHIDLAFNTIAPAISNIRAGRVRALAVAASARSPALADVPTAAEAGLPGYDAVFYYGLAAPAGTPPPIIDRLNQELRRIVTEPDVKERLIAEGTEPVAGTPDEYAANIVREEGKWAALVKKLGIKIE